MYTYIHTYIRIYIQQLISQFRRISPPGVSSSDTLQAYTYLLNHDYPDPDPLPPLVQLILEFLLVCLSFRKGYCFSFFPSEKVSSKNQPLKYRLSSNSGNISNFLFFLAICISLPLSFSLYLTIQLRFLLPFNIFVI